jgi:hypothetical protein
MQGQIKLFSFFRDNLFADIDTLGQALEPVLLIFAETADGNVYGCKSGGASAHDAIYQIGNNTIGCLAAAMGDEPLLPATNRDRVRHYLTPLDLDDLARLEVSARRELQLAASALNRSATGAVGDEHRGPKGGTYSQDNSKYRSWTQTELDKAIQDYKARRAPSYDDLLEGVRKKRKGAKKAAEKMFGRNAIARELGVKPGSRGMISKSPVWQQMADDFGFDRRSKGSRGKKIGLDIALEQQAAAEPDMVAEEVARRETLRTIDKAIRSATTKEADGLRAIREKYEAGEMTADQACAAVKIYTGSEPV